MNGTLPKRISSRWLSGRKQILAITCRETHDGQTNPAYVELAAEIEEATSELARWEHFEAWMKEQGFKTGKGTFDAGKVFIRVVDKQTNFRTIEAGWERYLAR